MAGCHVAMGFVLGFTVYHICIWQYERINGSDGKSSQSPKLTHKLPTWTSCESFTDLTATENDLKDMILRVCLLYPTIREDMM